MPTIVMFTEVATLANAVSWSLFVAFAVEPLLFKTNEQLKAIVSFAAIATELRMSCVATSATPSGLSRTVTVFAADVVLVRMICFTTVVVSSGTV
jgi:hypothetical protein